MQTQGSLRDGGLATLLQTMQSERATGTLVLQRNGDTASLYFLFGHLFHASGQQGQGEDVVVDALGWTDGDYQFDPRAKLPAEETIKASPAELIATAQSRGGVATETAEAAEPAEEPAVAAAGGGWSSSDFSVVEPAAQGSSPADLTYTPPTPTPVTSQPTQAPAYTASPDSGLASWAATQNDVSLPSAEAGSSTAPATEEAPAPDASDAWPPAPSPAAAESATPAYSAASSSSAEAGSGSARPQPLGAPGSERDDVMYPFPAGRAHYEGLKSAFVDFPRLLRTLRSDRHTGYVRLSGNGYLCVILLHEGQALEAVNSDGTVTKGEAAFQQIRRHMESGDGLLDVIELDRDIVLAVARLFSAPYLYTGLLGRFVNLDALLEYLSEEKLDGSVLVSAPSEMGVILLGGGSILGCYSESRRTLDKSTAAVASLATDRSSRIEVKGGTGSVVPIDVDAALSRSY